MAKIHLNTECGTWYFHGTYAERHIPKTAGFYWNDSSGLWWTKDSASAAEAQALIGAANSDRAAAAGQALAKPTKSTLSRDAASTATDLLEIKNMVRVVAGNFQIPDEYQRGQVMVIDSYPYKIIESGYCYRHTGTPITDDLGRTGVNYVRLRLRQMALESEAIPYLRVIYGIDAELRSMADIRQEEAQAAQAQAQQQAQRPAA